MLETETHGAWEVVQVQKPRFDEMGEQGLSVMTTESLLSLARPSRVLAASWDELQAEAAGACLSTSSAAGELKQRWRGARAWYWMR